MVSILLPHHLRLEIGRVFLKEEMPVQMQKPIGLAIRDGRELCRVAVPWRHLKGMAGARWFGDHGVHRTDWMIETCGPAATVHTQTRQIESHRGDGQWGRLEADVEDLVCATLTFESVLSRSTLS